MQMFVLFDREYSHMFVTFIISTFRHLDKRSMQLLWSELLKIATTAS